MCYERMQGGRSRSSYNCEASLVGFLAALWLAVLPKGGVLCKNQVLEENPVQFEKRLAPCI